MHKVIVIRKSTKDIVVEGYGSTTIAAESQARLILRELVEREGRKWNEFEILYDD